MDNSSLSEYTTRARDSVGDPWQPAFTVKMAPDLFSLMSKIRNYFAYEQALITTNFWSVCFVDVLRLLKTNHLLECLTHINQEIVTFKVRSEKHYQWNSTPTVNTCTYRYMAFTTANDKKLSTCTLRLVLIS